MISICRACSHTICCHRIDSSRLTRSRSFDCSKSTCRLIRAVPPCLFAHPIRRAGRSMAGVLGIPSAAFSASPGLAVLRPSLRSSDTRDGAMMSPAYQSAGGIDDGRRRRFMRRGGLLFRYDPTIVRLRRSVLLFVCPIRETGRGLFVSSRPVVRLLVAVIDGVADGDGVPIDGV